MCFDPLEPLFFLHALKRVVFTNNVLKSITLLVFDFVQLMKFTTNIKQMINVIFLFYMTK
ncbi:hypothetical protein KY46_08570 [Photobacterium halotolerans]|uniref:Uncharacterized protein n=1 Tax=Photobacterium halotolerans TaxID=265726 RepID=A0A0F5VDP7_9GAMM|nr:hypothetical protein KY46_08570 [Photobacterium halotolerans]